MSHRVNTCYTMLHYVTTLTHDILDTMRNMLFTTSHSCLAACLSDAWPNGTAPLYIIYIYIYI